MEEAVKKALNTTTFKATGYSGGGCISSGSSYLTDSGTVFVKVNNKSKARLMFDGEYAGLEAILNTNTVRVPKPMAVVSFGPGNQSAALVMENLKFTSMTSTQQAVLGEKLALLAMMHLHNAKRLKSWEMKESRVGSSGDAGGAPITQFGFHVPTCCGYIDQDNTWQDDWTVFYVRQKLEKQVQMLLAEKGDRDLNDVWPICRQNIECILSKLNSRDTKVIPSIVHGDLWSGNVSSADGEPVIFDPASFYGHSEYDFGIANMFSGFSSSFYSSYHKIIPKTEGFSKREKIYELFHHLNHWNHFGSGYKGSTIRIMKEIVKLKT